MWILKSTFCGFCFRENTLYVDFQDDLFQKNISEQGISLSVGGDWAREETGSPHGEGLVTNLSFV